MTAKGEKCAGMRLDLMKRNKSLIGVITRSSKIKISCHQVVSGLTFLPHREVIKKPLNTHGFSEIKNVFFLVLRM